MPYIERRNAPTLYYELDDFTDPWRRAPVLILQHGFGRSSRFWSSWVPYLSRFYRVVRPDLRGLGRSQSDFDLDTGITVESYIKDLLAVINALGTDSVHYCGESLGGILGMVLASEHPERIRTLSLVAAPVFINEQTQRTFAFGRASWQDALREMGSYEWAKAANTATRFPPGTDPGLLAWYAEEMGKSNVDVLVAVSHLASRVNVTPYLERIKAPVLGLYPSGGSITSQEQEELLASHIRNIRIVHLDARTHAILNISPAACAMHVLHFAAQFDGAPCRE